MWYMTMPGRHSLTRECGKSGLTTPSAEARPSRRDRVWVFRPVCKKGLSPKLQSQWRGPGEVFKRLSEVVYRVRIPGRGRPVVLRQDWLACYRPHAPTEAGEEGSDEVPLDRVAIPQAPPPTSGQSTAGVCDRDTSRTMFWMMGLSRAIPQVGATWQMREPGGFHVVLQ